MAIRTRTLVFAAAMVLGGLASPADRGYLFRGRAAHRDDRLRRHLNTLYVTTQGAYLSPSPLPNGRVLVSYAPNASQLRSIAGSL